MSRQNRYSPEVMERAVRLVLEQQDEHGSRWAAIGSVVFVKLCKLEVRI